MTLVLDGSFLLGLATTAVLPLVFAHTLLAVTRTALALREADADR